MSETTLKIFKNDLKTFSISWKECFLMLEGFEFHLEIVKRCLADSILEYFMFVQADTNVTKDWYY